MPEKHLVCLKPKKKKKQVYCASVTRKVNKAAGVSDFANCLALCGQTSDEWRIMPTLYHNEKRRTPNPRHLRSGNTTRINASVTRNDKKTRINIGTAFTRWKALTEEKGFQSDAQVASFLLDRWSRKMSSKTDSPPSYEDALQHPKTVNYPFQTQHGTPLTPPPSYSPSPSACIGPPSYWSQGGVYPQAGMCPGPGFSQPIVPIPTLSAGLPASSPGEMDDFISNQWETTSIRHAFIRKVYLILTAQLAVTFAVVAVFTFVDPVKEFVIKFPALYWASFVVFFLVYCILICCKEPRRRFPLNLVLLGIFTVALSLMAGSVSSFYETKAVIIAMGITAIVCIAVTVFCFQTKVDFTSCSGFLCIASVLLMIIGIVTAIVLSFQYVPWLHMLYAAIGAVVYTLFLVYNTQLLIGNRELAISPEEYIYGALSLYVDIVHIFLFILQISGAATE